MSTIDTRNYSAVMKRAEQLKRWEESETNRESPHPKSEKSRKIRFPSGCVFLASCLSGDKDEVVNLIKDGADINTANVDGLTALHQACIDDNLEMVEFLVKHKADINRQDNEGWTPLHATASCGFVSIARFLVENGADLTAVNSDGELAVDIAHCSEMVVYLQNLVEEHRIDCDAARKAEEQLMLSDANKWLRSDASEIDKPHPKTGATALHVAAAKGYTKVLSLLLAGRANVDKQDNDGWTPLHAAAHWCQKEAAEMLVDAMADMDVRNYAGQTCIDVADRKVKQFLEELKANNKRTKRRPSYRIPDHKIENHIDTSAPQAKLIRFEVKPDVKDQDNDEKSKPQQQQSSTATTKPTESNKVFSDSTINDDDAPWRRNTTNNLRSKPEIENPPPKIQVPERKEPLDSDIILRRTQSFENDEKKPVSPPVSPNTPATTPNVNAGKVRWSFVPPVRDEESETQRKAHAKRVRETRRSTQGVTLEEIKSAEELLKKKNATINNNNNNFKLEDASSGTTYPPSNNTIISSAPAVIAAANLSSSVAQRRNISNNSPISSNQHSALGQRPVSAPANTNTTSSATTTTESSNDNRNRDTTTSDLTILKRNKSSEDKENEQENDSRPTLATQSVIQRRRKPKRRSTGVVHVDMDDIDPEKQDSAGDNDEKESGNERTSRSRLGSSTNSLADSDNKKSTENGEVDYKALWEAAMLDNDKLKQQLKKKDEEVEAAKATVERVANATSKNSLSEIEKRERRAMERKFSEMEEELKLLQKLKIENERLRAENRALTRVVSKLTTSAQSQLQNRK